MPAPARTTKIMPSTLSHPTARAATLFSLLLVATAQAAPSVEKLAPVQHKRAAQTYEGCYSSSTGLSNVGTWQYQSTGYCGDQCTGNGNQAVLGLTSGNDCYCGNSLPPASAKVDDSKCNTPCFGFGTVMCGGSNFWSVYLTGASANVPVAGGSSSSGSSSASSSAGSTTSTSPSSTAAATPSTTAGPSTTPTDTPGTEAQQTIVTSIVASGTTVVVTQPAAHESTASASPSPSNKSSGGGGSNTAGIAAGVVVGVVAAAAIIGGIFFFLRRRRQREAEEAYKTSSQGNNAMRFEPKPPGTGYSQASDQRLDPSFGRRNSVGSMADSQDYSRRILRVANPDGH